MINLKREQGLSEGAVEILGMCVQFCSWFFFFSFQFVFKVSTWFPNFFLTLRHALKHKSKKSTFLWRGGCLPLCFFKGHGLQTSGHRALLSRELIGVEELNRTALFRRRCNWSTLVLFHRYELRWMSLCRQVSTISVIVFFVSSVSEQGELARGWQWLWWTVLVLSKLL